MSGLGGNKHIPVKLTYYLLLIWLVLSAGVILAWLTTSQWLPGAIVACWAGILIPVIGIGFYFKNVKVVNNNIEKAKKAIESLAQGELGFTLEVDSDGELDQLKAGINDLSANLQELMLHIWQQTARSQRFLNLLETALRQAPNGFTEKGELLPHVRDAMAALADLRQLVTAYAFYDVSLEDERPVATNTEKN